MKKLITFIIILLFSTTLSSCSSKSDDKINIGVSFGVGSATRWEKEKIYMEERAAELGINIEVIINKTDTPTTQSEDCANLVDKGVDVLIVTPRDVNNVSEIVSYAKKNKVPVISYARIITGEPIELFVGYDSNRIGQKLGQYLSEKVYAGDYIILSGDKNDSNAKLLYEGSMRYISPSKNGINIILDESVPNWDPVKAKEMVKAAIIKNNYKIDAILAPNDKIAGACDEVIKELGITNHVSITGMDAELDAIKRIANNSQDVTVYMDLKTLATTAVDEAYNMAKGNKVNVNSDFDNNSGASINANLITGQLITKENLDKLVIESGIYTHEEVYGN